MRRVGLGLLVLLLVAQARDTTHRPLELRADPRFSTAWFQDVRVRTRIEPDPENRWLELAIDGEHFASSDGLQLNGASAPITSERWFKHVPQGVYEVRASLYRRALVATATATVQIGGEP